MRGRTFAQLVRALPARRAYRRAMPRYEFRCRECADTFEVTRPMSAAGDPASCPSGHDDTAKLLSAVAVGGRAGRGPAPMPAGGCCGGGCGCR